MRIAMDFFEACERLSNMLADHGEQLAHQLCNSAAECAESLGGNCATFFDTTCCQATSDASHAASGATDHAFDAGTPRWV
jgi:hypothetical protein